MIYQWKQARFGIEAQEAGEELERIEDKRKALTPAVIVDESRAEHAVLHGCFEWDNETAAEKYREVQAGTILRNIVTVSMDGKTEHNPIRARVSIQGDYKRIDTVLRVEEYRIELLDKAKSELQDLQRRYHDLDELAGVFAEVDKLGA